MALADFAREAYRTKSTVVVVAKIDFAALDGKTGRVLDVMMVVVQRLAARQDRPNPAGQIA